MKLTSSILLILYASIMSIPLFSKEITIKTKTCLTFCEVLTLLHLVLFFNNILIILIHI